MSGGPRLLSTSKYWRAWMVTLGAMFAGGAIVLKDGNPVWDITTPAEIWIVLWLPAGIVTVAYGISGRAPSPAAYLILPALLGTGAASRAIVLVLAGSSIAPVPWLLVTTLIVPAWQKAVPTSVVFPRGERRTTPQRG